jgi:hypothetical protein
MNLRNLYNKCAVIFVCITALAASAPSFAQNTPERLDLRSNAQKLKDHLSNIKLQEIKLQLNYCFLVNRPQELATRNIFQESTDKTFGANIPAFDLQFLFGSKTDYDDRNFFLLAGIGVGATQYNFDNQVQFVKNNENKLVYKIDSVGAGYVQNRVSHRYLEIPLSFSVRIIEKIYWDNSVTLGWNFHSVYKNRYVKNGYATRENKNISAYANDFRASLQTGVNLGRVFSLYVNWQPTAQFIASKSDIKTNPWKLGMAFHFPVGVIRD